MANVPDSSLKTWNDGDTLHASDYDQDRSILQVAINDNNTRVGNQETKTKNMANDGSDYTGTWKGFSIDQLKNLATSIKTKTWVATSGQTAFVLGTSDDPYVVGNNSTELFVGGILQTLGEGYTETNTTTITTTEGVASGTEVTLRYQLTMAITDTPISQLIGYSALATQSWVQGIAQMFKLTSDSGVSKTPIASNGNAITDFNSLTTPGEYYFGAGLTYNAPIASSADAGVIIVRNPSSNVISQQVIYSGGNAKLAYMYSRSSYQGVWGSWDKFTQVNTDFARSLSESGYQKLPNGLIIQWGKAASVATGVTTNITLPIAFPNAIFAVAPGISGASGPCGYVPVVGSLTQIGLIQSQGAARDMYFFATGW